MIYRLESLETFVVMYMWEDYISIRVGCMRRWESRGVTGVLMDSRESTV